MGFYFFECIYGHRYGTMKKIKITESQLKKLIENKNLLIEGSGEYEVYHSTYTSAINSALSFIKNRGFETSGDEVWREISTGPKKPSEGQTNKISLTLFKDGKEQKKLVHIQVYNTGSKYELNVYIN